MTNSWRPLAELSFILAILLILLGSSPQAKANCPFPGPNLGLVASFGGHMAVSVSEVVIVPDREELKVFLCTLWGFGQRFFEVEIASFRPRQARLVGGEGDIELVSANDDTMFGSRRLGLCSDSSCQVELAAGNCDVESPCLGYVIYEVIVRNGSGRFVLGEFSLSTVPRLHPVY